MTKTSLQNVVGADLHSVGALQSLYTWNLELTQPPGPPARSKTMVANTASDQVEWRHRQSAAIFQYGGLR